MKINKSFIALIKMNIAFFLSPPQAPEARQGTQKFAHRQTPRQGAEAPAREPLFELINVIFILT